MTKPKAPQPNAVSKMRDAYNRIRNRPLTKEQRNELSEVFRKKNEAENKPKKIARSDIDTEL